MNWTRRLAPWFLCVVTITVLAACSAERRADVEEPADVDDVETVVEIEPRNEGQIVELTGDYTAELAIRALDGMVFVYLYDAAGEPVEYPGKTVSVTLSTPDGESVHLELEGMGQGNGAHFMNRMDETLLENIKAQGGYGASIEVVEDGESQTGDIDFELGG